MGTKSKKKKAPKAKAAEEKPARLSKHHQRMLMPACSTLENKVLKGLDWGDDRCGCEEAGYSPWGYHRCQKVQAALPAKERDPHLTPEFILDGVRAHTAYTCLQYLKNKLIHVPRLARTQSIPQIYRENLRALLQRKVSDRDDASLLRGWSSKKKKFLNKEMNIWIRRGVFVSQGHQGLVYEKFYRLVFIIKWIESLERESEGNGWPEGTHFFIIETCWSPFVTLFLSHIELSFNMCDVRELCVMPRTFFPLSTLNFDPKKRKKKVWTWVVEAWGGLLR